jgi:hypothetical protein
MLNRVLLGVGLISIVVAATLSVGFGRQEFSAVTVD